MKKIILILTSIVLLCTSAYGSNFREEQRDHIIKVCEDRYKGRGYYDETSMLYGCIITQFYALDKVINFVIEVDRGSEDWKTLTDLLEKHYWPSDDTYDFKAIHLDFEEYLKGKNKPRF